MKLPLITAVAMTAAMLVSGPSMAQTMIGGATLTAEELPIVQAHCDELARVNATGQTNTSEKPVDEQTDAAAGDKALVTSIDLDVLTLDDCKTAGLVQ